MSTPFTPVEPCGSCFGGPLSLRGRTVMHEYEVEVNWNGTVAKGTVRANTPATAKRAALTRHPGGTLRRIVRVEGG